MNKKIIASLAIAVAAIATMSGVVPANAAPAGVAVSQTTGVARTGSLTVNLSGIPAGQGVYVMFCAKSATTARPAACFGRGVWASTDTSALAQGAVSAANPIALPVAATFTPQGGTAVDCDLTSCGVFVRRDHMGPTDFSLDQFVPVAFVSAVPSKVTAVVTSGRVLVSIDGHKGQSITVTLAGRTITKQLLADQVKFFVGNGGNAKAKLIVKVAGSKLFAKALVLKN